VNWESSLQQSEVWGKKEGWVEERERVFECSNPILNIKQSINKIEWRGCNPLVLNGPLCKGMVPQNFHFLQSTKINSKSMEKCIVCTAKRHHSG